MDNQIGENIKRFRELRGFTQDFMADKLNLTQSAYGKIEKETVKLTIERLQKIAEILEVDLANLINAKNQNIFNLYNNAQANGYIENQYSAMKETYEKLVQAKQDEIDFLKEMLGKK